jgi:hypothetical protein
VSLPTIDDKYTDAIFNALMGMDVPLDDDPIVFGPKRQNAKVAQCRKYLDQCQRIFQQVSRDMHILSRHLRAIKADFDLRMQDMLANDAETRGGRSLKDREAIATMKLREYREEIEETETSIKDLESVMIVVKSKREDLRDIQGRLKDQLKLVQEELNLGARWGSRAAPGSEVPDIRNTPSTAALYSSMGAVAEDQDPLAALVKTMGSSLEDDEVEEDDEVVSESGASSSGSLIAAENETPPLSNSLSPAPEQTPPLSNSPDMGDEDIDALLFNLNPSETVSRKVQVETPVVADFDLDSLLSS